MKTRAYSELYLDTSPRILGDAFDYAANTMAIGLERFMDLFIVSGYAEQFEGGNPAVVAGINGCELVKKAMDRCGLSVPVIEDVMYLDKSPEYWAGWALAQYQWFAARPFEEILEIVSLQEILRLYPAYHEADITKFFSIMEERWAEKGQATRLRMYRDRLGLSQSELAREAGVSVRQIQLFEQRQRDINKTQAQTVEMLARALHVSGEALLERA